MVVDTSALIAIALGERSRSALLDRIGAATVRLISSVSVLEAGIVLRARLGAKSDRLLNELIEELALEIAAFDDIQARRAIAAFGQYGKGMGHRAPLNFGDCAVYALADLKGQPILAIGGVFSATDLVVLRPNHV